MRNLRFHRVLLAVLALFATSSAAAESALLSFRNDILPILHRAGCASGACHAKAEGQYGFQLSVFAFDPKTDYREIVHDARGRRVFAASPENSLLLLKATNTVAHEGGERFQPGSDFHRTLVEWIRQGMPYGAEDEAALTKIEATPAQKTARPGETLRLRVAAHFSDGTKRDVTHLCEYRSGEPGFATVDHDGRVEVGEVPGEGVIVARYVDAVAAVRLAVPPSRTLPAERYESLPVANEIDRLAYARHRQLGVLAAGPCTDAEFLRRLHLDVLGILPPVDKVRAFLADEAEDKRARLIDELHSDEHATEWADHLATKWGDLLRGNTRRIGVKPVYLMDQWIRDQFLANRPYDRWVRDLLTAQGSTHVDGRVSLFRDKREPADLAEFTSRIFLGTRLECARCHHHPSEKWSQHDYFSFAAFFSSMKRKGQGISAPISGEPEFWWFEPGGTVSHPVSGEVLQPKPPGGEVVEIDAERDPREALVEWMTDNKNPYFARAAVNRVWGEMFGRGIVHPIDDFRESNPPANGLLLDWLAADFAGSGYDLRHLVRVIASSYLYQQSSVPSGHNLGDQRQFSRSYRRRLPAEVVHDAVATVVGEGSNFEGLPAGSSARRTWTHLIRSDFLDTFGRPGASEECPCERSRMPSVVQALHLLNSPDIERRLARDGNRAAELAERFKDDQAALVEEVYLLVFARFPDDEEKKIALGHLKGDLRMGTEDLLWALINTAEFVFNH